MGAGRGSENHHPCHRELMPEEKSTRTEKTVCSSSAAARPRWVNGRAADRPFRRGSSPTNSKTCCVIVGIRGDSGYVSTRKPFGISVRYGFGQFWVPL